MSNKLRNLFLPVTLFLALNACVNEKKDTPLCDAEIKNADGSTKFDGAIKSAFQYEGEENIHVITKDGNHILVGSEEIFESPCPDLPEVK